jgi:hypothetical protein
MNKGYGYFWLGECFQMKCNYFEALCCYLNSKNIGLRFLHLKLKLLIPESIRFMKHSMKEGKFLTIRIQMK